jgi:uncharacterized protein YhfF
VDSFAFGDSPALADELLALVLAGHKTATSGLAAEYEAEGAALPRPGDVACVLDGAGRPACTIRTTHVEVKAFRDVDAAFARAEGEGDRSLSGWRDGHRRYFTRRCDALGIPFDEDLMVVCEHFELVSEPRSTRRGCAL